MDMRPWPTRALPMPMSSFFTSVSGVFESSLQTTERVASRDRFGALETNVSDLPDHRIGIPTQSKRLRGLPMIFVVAVPLFLRAGRTGHPDQERPSIFCPAAGFVSGLDLFVGASSRLHGHGSQDRGFPTASINPSGAAEPTARHRLQPDTTSPYFLNSTLGSAATKPHAIALRRSSARPYRSAPVRVQAPYEPCGLQRS